MHLQGNGGGMGTLKDPDRTNNVEQVKVSYLPAGDVSIEVTFHLTTASYPYPVTASR